MKAFVNAVKSKVVKSRPTNLTRAATAPIISTTPTPHPPIARAKTYTSPSQLRKSTEAVFPPPEFTLHSLGGPLQNTSKVTLTWRESLSDTNETREVSLVQYPTHWRALVKYCVTSSAQPFAFEEERGMCLALDKATVTRTSSIQDASGHYEYNVTGGTPSTGTAALYNRYMPSTKRMTPLKKHTILTDLRNAVKEHADPKVHGPLAANLYRTGAWPHECDPNANTDCNICALMCRYPGKACANGP